MEHKKQALALSLIFFAPALPFCSEKPIFNFAELKTSVGVKIPEDGGSKEISSDSGLKLSFRNLDLRIYESVEKTEFDSLPVEIPKDHIENPRYGAGVYLFQETLPLTLKAGKNSYSKSLSKIRKPSPSFSDNPISGAFAFSHGLGPTLPTLASSEQPLSASISLSSEKILPAQISFEAFADEEKNSAFSICASKKIGKLDSAELSITGARLFVEGKSSILKKTGADFNSDFFLSGLAEFSFRSPLLKTILRGGIQESPYETDSLWFSANARSAWRNFLVDISYFAIPTAKDSPKSAPLACPGGIQRTVEQAAVRPQVAFLLGKSGWAEIRFGASAVESWKISSTKDSEMLNVGKLRAGGSLETNPFGAKIDFTAANILISGEPKTKSARPEKYYGASTTLDFRAKKLNASANLSAKVYPPLDGDASEKRSIDAKISAVPGKSRILSAYGKISADFKDLQRTAGEISAGATLRLKAKKIITSAKAEVKMAF